MSRPALKSVENYGLEFQECRGEYNIAEIVIRRLRLPKMHHIYFVLG